MTNLAGLDWPLILSIIGVVIAGIELSLILLDRKNPPETRQKTGGLRVVHLIKKVPSYFRRAFYAIKLRLSRRNTKKAARIFISYKRDIEPDESLATSLFQALKLRGHKPYIDKDLVVGIPWSKEIHKQIKGSDFLIVLLSEVAANSEMVAEELSLAEECHAGKGHPITLPVRVNYIETLPYHLDKYIGHLHYILWRNVEDQIKVQEAIFKAVEDGFQLPDKNAIKELQHLRRENSLPVPQADPRLIEIPSGAVSIQSPFYIRRDCDNAIERQTDNQGSTTTIRAGRQMGKTSLLVRAVSRAKDLGYKVVYIDFQSIHKNARSSLDHLLKHLAYEISLRLNLDESLVAEAWSSPRGAPDKFNQFMESYVLDERCAIMLAIDEADQLMGTDYKSDFFALLRSWDSRRAFDPLWSCLHIAIVISTHPHLLIDDHMQSPFNVGLRLELDDFDREQVQKLNELYKNPLNDEEIPNLMRLLGGHPYLTRQAFYSMVEHQLGWAEMEELATSEHGPFRSHLHFYLSQLAKQTRLVEGLKEILSSHRCSDENVLYRLSAAGLVRELPGQKVEARCGLYEKYFKNSLNA